MKQLILVALVVGLVAAPAWAQREGGARGGDGFHGGFASHGMMGAHGGGYGFAGRAHGGDAYGSRPYEGNGAVTARRPSYGGPWSSFYHQRSSFYNRNGYGYGLGFGDGYAPSLGYGYVVDGPWNDDWLDEDDDTDDGDAYAEGGPEGYGDGGGPGGPPEGYGDGGGPGGPPEGYGYYPPLPYYVGAMGPGGAYGYGVPPGPGEAGMGAGQPEAQQGTPDGSSAGLYNSSAVTLVFKNGRPPETIHNYVLTRTMLYVTDKRRQQIPVSALNLAATERVNRAAGVTFQLPVGQ